MNFAAGVTSGRDVYQKVSEKTGVAIESMILMLGGVRLNKENIPIEQELSGQTLTLLG